MMSKRPELDTTNPPGQIVNPVAGTPYIPKPGTLGMYIDKTIRHEAMLDRQWNKKKLTFGEWCEEAQILYRTIETKDDLFCIVETVWKAAQENV